MMRMFFAWPVIGGAVEVVDKTSKLSPYLTGAAAILGALVGGTASGLAIYKVEKLRHKHALEERATSDRRLARGLARVLVEDFIRAYSHAKVEITADSWSTPVSRPGLAREDRKELFAHLDGDQFAAVVRAYAALDELDDIRSEVMSATYGTSPPPPSKWGNVVPNAICAAEAAAQMLTRVAMDS